MNLGPYVLGPTDDEHQGIYTGDSRVLELDVPDNSAHLILCDPVYNEVWQYSWVAKVAARVLVFGGSVVAQAGHIHRFQAECAMIADEMVRRPLITEKFTGGFRSLWMHHALRADAPYIWLEKGEIGKREWIPTSFFGRKDKTHHEWGDGVSGFAFLIERFTSPGDIVFDPFSGGATIAVACKILGRYWLSFEIDPEVAQGGRDRVRSFDPLFVPEPEQMELGV